MKACIRILLFTTFFYGACHKKPAEQTAAPATVTPVPVDSTLICKDLPVTPQPFGWHDSTINEDRNVNAFVYNPANADEIIYIANGDAFGYNKMFSINLRTKAIIYLATLGPYLPSINSKGWIVYSTDQNDVFKIKVNGDSARQLTNNKLCQDPHWDYSGIYIYYYQEAYFNVGTELVKADANGKSLVSVPIGLPYIAVFRNSDKVIFLQTQGSTATLILKDMVKFSETQLITGPFDPKSRIYFDNLCLDQSDQNLYWSNAGGIFRCNLISLKTDTVKKSCANTIYDRPMMLFKSNEMSFSIHVKKPLNSALLFHEFKAMEMNYVSGEMTEVKMFP